MAGETASFLSSSRADCGRSLLPAPLSGTFPWPEAAGMQDRFRPFRIFRRLTRRRISVMNLS
jgi:hypothetical protein